MDIEVLVSTMNLENYEDLIEKMNISGKVVVINQLSNNKIQPINISINDRRVYSYKEKGLSLSRNRAIQNSTADICVIADDDLVYKKDYKDIIINAFLKYKNADIIAFYVQSKNEERPTTKQKEGRIKYLKSMKVASFQIAIKRDSIVKNNIVFDTNFGAGSGKYLMGEENIFLFECLKKGLKIYFVPLTIADVYHNESTWYQGFNKELFLTKGAVFYRMSPLFSILFIMQFAVRKYKLYKNNISFFEAIKYMLEGRNEFRSKFRSLI